MAHALAPHPDTSRRRGVPRLASGTPSWLGVAWAAAGLSALTRSGRRLGFATAFAGAVSLFFRDPARTVGEGLILAAADGICSSVELQPDGRTRVATYMSLRDVHVNRSPVDGEVLSMEHREGGYRPAFTKESERNERLVWKIASPEGPIEMVQIAGTLARRIVPYFGVGQNVVRGDRVGLIRFGSRVDVYLPPGMAAAVRPGQRMRAGSTRLDRG
ncbi:MAG: phosphatidylserine decarboxylase [Thermoleophilaceae bacterium]